MQRPGKDQPSRDSPSAPTASSNANPSEEGWLRNAPLAPAGLDCPSDWLS